MSTESIRSSRLVARTTPEVLAIVKRAAELQGRSVSDFVVAATQDAAYKIIEEAGIIRLSAEDQMRFVDLLLNPHQLAPALVRAKDSHQQLLVSE